MLGSVFSARAEHALHGRTPDPGRTANALSSGQAGAVIRRGGDAHLVHAAFASGLNAAFVVAGVLGIAAGLVAMLTLGRPAMVAQEAPAPA